MAMKIYQDNGPIFGEILYDLYHKIKNDPEYAARGKDIESDFINQCYVKCGSGIQFPFREQINCLREPFEHAICISIDDQVAHGKPQNRKLKSNSVISVDCGMSLPCGNRRLNFDAAFTVQLENLNWTGKPACVLKEIIQEQPQDTWQIADIISSIASISGLKQVVSMTGHGIGYQLHEAPTIHNAPGNFASVKLFDGLCFCAEPIFVHPGKDKDSSFTCPTYLGTDGWEVFTVSGEQASHFETTFGIINGQIIDLIGVTNWKL